ncbi:MAG: isopentenyl-diphosphate Delta-isomerase [Candidatus Peribacteraceae bacterium]|nr:isopentenyl-diphosphate Delta-isomerase [Candidatus Peribacteraceae bacterium]MDD5743086.1 isopentenyl-diphosphate Delta-isomerase [Candidatus Peribacteraceae bacterium]
MAEELKGIFLIALHGKAMLNTMSLVILSTEDGTPMGTAERENAHASPGMLHRAFSVFVFRNGRRELLIQQRSKQKTLFPLIWANTCCSHLQEEEVLPDAAQMRLHQELGFTCQLKEGASFVYRADDPEGRGTEYEYDTILIGNMQGNPPLKPDPSEVAATKWITTEELTKDMHVHPLLYAPWFLLAFPMVMQRPKPYG